MWLLDGSTGGETKTDDSIFPAAGTKSPLGFFKDVQDAFNYAKDPKNTQGFFIALENEAKKTTKNISNGLLINQTMIGETMFNVYKDTLKYGGAIKDVTDYITDYAEAIGKIPNIQDETIKRAIIFSKATGISTKEVGQFVGNMAKVGIGQDNALSKLEKVYLTARKFGIDAGKLTGEVNKNLSKASTYGFKGGIDGLTKMAASAQQLGISMDMTMKTANKLLNDPDEFIKMASEIQMLGGAVGALGDPFQLLYMAQNDIGKLQDEIVKATQSTVEFNEETGEFKLPVSEMYRMREMASKLGLDYDELANAAINAAKQQTVLTKLGGLPSYSEEDKKLIASLSEIQKDGSVKIQIPGAQGMIDASTVTADQLEKIRKDQEQKEDPQAAMVDIANNQLSAQNKAAIALEEIKNSIVFAKGIGGLKGTEDYPDMLNKLSGLGSKMASTITNLDETAELIKKTDELLNKQITNFTTYVDNESKLKADLRELIVNINKAYDVNSPDTERKVIDPGKDLLDKTPVAQGKTSDLIDLSAIGKKTYTDGFGKMWDLDKNDQVLAMPNIDELFNFSNKAYETLSSIQKSTSNMNYSSLNEMLSSKQTGLEKIDYGSVTEMLMNRIKPTTNQPEQINNLQDILSRSVPKMNEMESININQTNTTTQKVEGSVGVDGDVNINVNVPNGLLSNALSGDREFQQTLKEEIMKVVNDRLSKAYSQRQGNFSS